MIALFIVCGSVCVGVVQNCGYDGPRLWNDWRNLAVLHGFH